MKNKLSLFLGRKVKYSDDISVYSPTIDEIEKITENIYNIYLLFSTFDLKGIFDVYSQLSLINVDVLKELEEYDDYDVLTSIDFIVIQLNEALSFFIKDSVNFDSSIKSFFIKKEKENIYFLNKDNYKEISNLIKEVNCLIEKKDNIKFRNETAKKMYDKIQKLKQQHNKHKILDLKDILSILCNAPDNGVNIFNVDKLTIYQVYEHLERLNIKEEHLRLLGVWQNGLLENSNQLKDWMVKTKL